MLTIEVTGTPVPQGSTRAFVVNGRAITTAANTKTKPWRQDVVAAALNAIADDPDAGWPLLGPLGVEITFALPRIKAHYRTGRRANELRENAPRWSDKKPDIDKLQRAILDALTDAGVWRDDSQVAQVTARKEYAEPGHTGASIRVVELDDTPTNVVSAAGTPPRATADTARTTAPGAPSPAPGAAVQQEAMF